MTDNSDILVLVVGGRGFLGAHLVRSLLTCGFRVRCFDLPTPHSAMAAFPSHDRLEMLDGDFSNADDIRAAVTGCQFCYHLVSTTTPQSSNLDPSRDVATNVISTINLLLELAKAKVKKIIFVSSGGTVYGNPLTIPIPESHPNEPVCSYGIGKLAIEKYLFLFSKLYGLDYTILRLSNPFGEGQPANKHQGAVAVFLNKCLSSQEIEIWGDGSVVRDYLYIADVVEALLAAQRYNGAERIFNIGSGIGLSLNDILDAIDQLGIVKTRRSYVAGRAFDISTNILSIAKAERELGWKPKINFQQGLTKLYHALNV